MKRAGLHLLEGGDPIQRQAAAWFARLRADDASGNDRERWQRWLDSDPNHRAAYERLERLWSSFGEHAAHTEIALRLRADAAPQTRPHRPVARQRRAGWLAATAAALLVVIAGTWLSHEPPPADIAYTTAIGERRTVALEDGTRVDLDTGTRLRVHYSDSERRLMLDRGRAFFRVAKEVRPLVVHTSSGNVRAVGTQFEVYRRDAAIEVALFEGRVQLQSADAADAGPVTLATLDPGQRAYLRKGDTRPRIESVALGRVPPWTSGRLVFEDITLAAAVAEFNRYNRQRIVVADDASGRLRVSGVFHNDDPQAFIDVVCSVYGLHAVPAPDGGTVLHTRRPPAQ